MNNHHPYITVSIPLTLEIKFFKVHESYKSKCIYFLNKQWALVNNDLSPLVQLL